MLNLKKGSAIIVAVMVVLIMSITLSGVIFLTGQSIQTTNRTERENKLFWAADGGANHALTWLRRLDLFKFIDVAEVTDTETAYNNSSSVNSFTLYNGEVEVSTSISYNTANSSWNVRSEAKYTDDRRACVVELLNIGGEPASKYAYGQLANMTGTTRFVAGQSIEGSTYFGGKVQMSAGSANNTKSDQFRFMSKTYFSRNITANSMAYSDGMNNQGIGTTHNNATNWLRSFLSKGIVIDNVSNTIGGNQATFNNTISGEASVDDPGGIFQKGVEIIDEINPEQGVTYTWNEMNKNSGTTVDGLNVLNLKDYLATFNSSNYSNLSRIQLEYKAGNQLEITYDIGASSIPRTVDMRGYDVVVVPKINSDFADISTHSVVEVKGVVSKSSAIYTETNDILITDNLYYEGLNPDDTHTDNIAQINTANFDIELGIFAGIGSKGGDGTGNITDVNDRGNILVDTNQDIKLITAGMFCPYGVMGTYGIQRAADTYGGGLDGGNYPRVTQEIDINIIGSIIMEKKGYWRSGGNGMNPQFYNDPRWADGNHRPIGYIPTQGLNNAGEGVNVVNSGYYWKVSWQ